MPHRKAQAEHNRHNRLPRVSNPATSKEVGETTGRRPGPGWTVGLRRQPALIVDGQPRGGFTDVFELICCNCGDDPGLDYRDTSPELQRIRGPYPFAEALAAYEKHVVRDRTRHADPLGESSDARGHSEQV